MKFRTPFFPCLLAVCLSVPAKAIEPSTPESVTDSAIRQMIDAETARLGRSTGYTGKRRYEIGNERTGLLATMEVDVQVDGTGAKAFRVLRMKAPAAVRKLVFERMLDTETRASQRDARERTRISPANYRFRFLDTRADRGRDCFVFEISPRTDNPLLFRGLIWVDAEEHAVTRIEGSPAQRPSWWVTATRFVHEYAKVGDQWLDVSNKSDTEVRIFGHTRVLIEYHDYRLVTSRTRRAESAISSVGLENR